MRSERSRCLHCGTSMVKYIPFGISWQGQWDCPNDFCEDTRPSAYPIASNICGGDLTAFHNVGHGYHHCWDCGKVYDSVFAEHLGYSCSAELEDDNEKG